MVTWSELSQNATRSRLHLDLTRKMLVDFDVSQRIAVPVGDPDIHRYVLVPEAVTGNNLVADRQLHFFGKAPDVREKEERSDRKNHRCQLPVLEEQPEDQIEGCKHKVETCLSSEQGAAWITLPWAREPLSESRLQRAADRLL